MTPQIPTGNQRGKLYSLAVTPLQAFPVGLIKRSQYLVANTARCHDPLQNQSNSATDPIVVSQ
jgi:hypothetical protein